LLHIGVAPCQRSAIIPDVLLFLGGNVQPALDPYLAEHFSGGAANTRVTLLDEGARSPLDLGNVHIYGWLGFGLPLAGPILHVLPRFDLIGVLRQVFEADLRSAHALHRRLAAWLDRPPSGGNRGRWPHDEGDPGPTRLHHQLLDGMVTGGALEMQELSTDAVG